MDAGTILVVDDDPAVLGLCTAALENSGYAVISVSSGVEAIYAFECRSSEIRLLLTDVQMPGMDGAELAECLRTIRPNLPVLYMSGCADADLIREHIVARGDFLVTKPFPITTLIARVSQILVTDSDVARMPVKA